MNRMTGPNCAVMCNLINTHTHYCYEVDKCDAEKKYRMLNVRFSFGAENERADAGRDGQTRLARPNSQARTGTKKKTFPTSADHH